jgi:hypothetical protein
MLDIKGKNDDGRVEFIAFNIDGPISNSMLTSIDINYIEKEIMINSEPELDYFDLDYRNER